MVGHRIEVTVSKCISNYNLDYMLICVCDMTIRIQFYVLGKWWRLCPTNGNTADPTTATPAHFENVWH